MEAECYEQNMDLLATGQLSSDSDGGDGAANGQDEPFETDPKRLLARMKQIDFAKNTIGYERYLQAVPKEKRKKFGKDHDPPTPDITQKISKRTWDGIVKAWRRHLHKFDNTVVNTAAQQDDDTAAADAPNPAASGASKRPSWSRRGGKRHKSNAQHGQQQKQQQQQSMCAADSRRGCTDTHAAADKPCQQQHRDRLNMPRHSASQVIMQEDKTLRHIKQQEEEELQLHTTAGCSDAAVQHSRRGAAEHVIRSDPVLPFIKQELLEVEGINMPKGGNRQHSRTNENQHRSGARSSSSGHKHSRSSLCNWDRDCDRSYLGSKAKDSRQDREERSRELQAANDKYRRRAVGDCSGYSRNRVGSSGKSQSVRNDRDARDSRDNASVGCSRRFAPPGHGGGRSGGSRSHPRSRAAQQVQQQQQHSPGCGGLGQPGEDWTGASKAVIKQQEVRELDDIVPAMRRCSWADCMSDQSEEEEGECPRSTSQQITPAKRRSSQGMQQLSLHS